MTIREAIIGEIEPYSLSDESIEKSFIDATSKFPVFGDIDCEYTSEMMQITAYSAMLCLNRLRVLSSENIGGISQSFNVEKLEKRIRAIANEAGISAEMVMKEDNENSITYMSVW